MGNAKGKLLNEMELGKKNVQGGWKETTKNRVTEINREQWAV